MKNYANTITINDHTFHCKRHELKTMCENMVMTRFNSMVEVGSLVGFSTKTFANYFDNVLSVDPYLAGYDDADVNSNDQDRLDTARAIFFFRFIDNEKVEQVCIPSLEACENIENYTLDMVYIDASHKYEDVLADILAWSVKARSGGYISGHDIEFPSVKKAVLEMYTDFATFGSSWIVRL